MAFAPTPARNTPPAQLLSLQAILAAAGGSSGGGGGGGGGGGSIAITNPPSTGTSGTALALAGTVSPAGTAVRVGLSSSATTAPSTWTNATVSGGGWTASLTPSSSGTYYIWAEQTSTPSVQAVSPAVVVSAQTGAPLTYSLITGSGDGSLTGVTLATGTGGQAAVDWSSSIVHGATDVVPNVAPSPIGTITSAKFWFDTSSTNTTVPSSGYGTSATINNGTLIWYNAASNLIPATAMAPPAPSTPGTYYGKYAMYDSGSTLLGVFVTSAITVV